jgi:hypothetical protein
MMSIRGKSINKIDRQFRLNGSSGDTKIGKTILGRYEQKKTNYRLNKFDREKKETISP